MKVRISVSCTVQYWGCRHILTTEILGRSQRHFKSSMWWTSDTDRVSLHQWPQAVHKEVQVRSPSSSCWISDGHSDKDRWFCEWLYLLLSVWFHRGVARVGEWLQPPQTTKPNERQNGNKCILNEKEAWFNLLNTTGYVMHQQFNIEQLYTLPTLYLCVLYLSENKQRLVPLTA